LKVATGSICLHHGSVAVFPGFLEAGLFMTTKARSPVSTFLAIQVASIAFNLLVCADERVIRGVVIKDFIVYLHDISLPALMFLMTVTAGDIRHQFAFAVKTDRSRPVRRDFLVARKTERILASFERLSGSPRNFFELGKRKKVAQASEFSNVPERWNRQKSKTDTGLHDHHKNALLKQPFHQEPSRNARLRHAPPL
jgi:hypothetical protein